MGIQSDHDMKEVVSKYQEVLRNAQVMRLKLMTVIGIELVKWVVADFRAKSDGKPGLDGETWKPITRTTIAGRLIAAADFSTDPGSRSGIGATGRRLLMRDRKGGNRRMRGKVVWMLANDPQAMIESLESGRWELEPKYKRKWKSVKKSRKGGKLTFTSTDKHEDVLVDAKKILKFHQKVLAEFSSAKTGVDTGRLVNSLTFGVPGMEGASGVPVSGGKQRPPEKAVFDVTWDSVTVGTRQSYAQHFDRLRPIFGKNFMSPQRQERLAITVEKMIRKLTGMP